MAESLTESFAVRVGEFEGPLPLLLELVEKRQLPISQVSLAEVADSFLDYVRSLPGPQMATLAEFLVTASTLMLIKSISLLPPLVLTETEQEDVSDLERRLKLYQVIRDASVALRASFGIRPIFFPPARQDRTVIFSPTAELTIANLLATIKNLIQSLPPSTDPLPKVWIKKIISLEETIKDLARRVESALKMNFSDFIKDQKEKINIIVGFLALLELCKQGAIEVGQTDHFQEIKIETKQTGIPRYTRL